MNMALRLFLPSLFAGGILATLAPGIAANPNTVCNGASPAPYLVCASSGWWIDYEYCQGGDSYWFCTFLVLAGPHRGWSDAGLVGQAIASSYATNGATGPSWASCSWPSSISLDPSGLTSRSCTLPGGSFYFTHTMSRDQVFCKTVDFGYEVTASVFASATKVNHDARYTMCAGYPGRWDYFT